MRSDELSDSCCCRSSSPPSLKFKQEEFGPLVNADNGDRDGPVVVHFHHIISALVTVTVDFSRTLLGIFFTILRFRPTRRLFCPGYIEIY